VEIMGLKWDFPCPLKISVSPDSRNTSWVSFDGRNRQELRHGDR
jgi:NAD kinase